MEAPFKLVRQVNPSSCVKATVFFKCRVCAFLSNHSEPGLTFLSPPAYVRTKAILKELGLSPSLIDNFISNEVDDSVLPLLDYSALRQMTLSIGASLKLAAYLKQHSNQIPEHKEFVEKTSSSSQLHKVPSAAQPASLAAVSDSPPENGTKSSTSKKKKKRKQKIIQAPVSASLPPASSTSSPPSTSEPSTSQMASIPIKYSTYVKNGVHSQTGRSHDL